LSELAGRKWSPTLINASNPRFRTYRRLFHAGLAPRATRTYFSSIETESEQLLRGLARLSKEENGGGKGAFVKLLRRNAGAVILRATYGWEVKSDDDELVKAIEKAFELGSVLVGKPWMVDIIPALRFVPEWAPFASFQTRARQFREQTLKVGTIPLAFTKEQVAAGTGIECFASKLLSEESAEDRNAEQESIIKEVCSSLYSGGADTTVSGLTSFILLMTLHPEVQTRIQSELDAVVGTDRLPLCTDTANLPYLQAVFKEVLRWAPPARICVPHVLKEDDIYEGYRIPKGTTVIANIHAIMRDSSDFPEPELFNPERFFGKEDEGVPDPRKFAFGFGRRICPGAHFAEQSMLLNMARIMSVFRIEKARGVDGSIVEPSVEWTTNIVSHAKPFECRFVPRSEEALALIGDA
ncbi:cytochrome P450, partial [Peniophora sp. CONT]